ncbi:MAG: reactive intermediate/imine deaminase [Deltaproteobacteria bacterium]|nr:MAG: reactive intermediate/imine deaminase [Deltaproteobacteria bacterium]
MERNIISTNDAPGAIGPYSQAVIAGGLLFISGQLPIDPATGKMLTGDIASKTSRIMQNLQAIAEQAGTSLARAVKTTIFLTDLADFQEVNEAYGKYFPAEPPARSTVQVAALPLGSNIEIEAVIAL